MEKMEKLERKLMPFAWRRLSQRFPLTKELLERYREQVDWAYVSQNRNIVWNTSMFEKFKDDIDWHLLSKKGDDQVVTFEHLERFKAYWDWASLSGNENVSWTYELLDRFADKWDWENIVNNWGMDDLFSMEFVERFQVHIPFSLLDESRLGDVVVEKLTEELEGQMAEEAGEK